MGIAHDKFLYLSCTHKNTQTYTCISTDASVCVCVCVCGGHICDGLNENIDLQMNKFY